jgi:hypothetical protein
VLDRHSEIIAHFIGIFDQASEQSLMRLHYDAFRAQERPNEEPGPLLNINIHVSSELPADKFWPRHVNPAEVDDVPRGHPGHLELFIRSVQSPETVFPAVVETEYSVNVDTSAPLFGSYDLTYVLPETPTVDIPPPGGFIHFAYQQNVLVDNDILLNRPLELSPALAASRTDAALDADFVPLAAVADALSPGDFTLARGTEDTGPRIEALRDTFAGVDPDTAPEGATATLVSQHDANLPESGILVDGAEGTDSQPDRLSEELESRLNGGKDDADAAEAEDDATVAGEADAVGTGKTDVPGTSDATHGGDDGRDAGGVVSGTFVIGPDETGPLEGAVQTIETGGNVLLNNAAAGLAPVDAAVIAVAGEAVSFTAISQVNVMSDRDVALGAGETVAAGNGHLFEDPISEGHNIASVHWEGTVRTETSETGPIGFAVVEIEGDLVFTTHVYQLNLVTDNDLIAFETTFHNVEVVAGENASFNLFSEVGVQSFFDMILVGGDMLNLVSLSQMNLLFDNDLLVDKDGVGGDVETGGNLLWNQAQITWHGIDSAADEVSDAVSDALAAVEDEDPFDFGVLKAEPLLAGNEVPLLLTVSGDLVFDYRVEQVNILADADTVQLFADRALDGGFNPIDLSTGDNLLANAAHLEIYGTDSTIMAEDGVYSDLVIYQAGMYDTDDIPLETAFAGSDLASEAVAFLAEGMIGDGRHAELNGEPVIIDSGGDSGTFDTLGGVVA